MRRYLVVLSAALACSVAVGLQAQQGQYYVLDGFGGVHAAGGAPALSPATPYFGFDIAVDIAYVPLGIAAGHGDGALILDGFGGIHAGGALAIDVPDPAPPYFGFDVARAIAYRNIPPRAGGATIGSTPIALVSGTWVAITSTTIHAPDDGLILVMASANVFCPTSGPGDTTGQFSLNIDSTAAASDLPNYFVGFADCTDFPPGLNVPLSIVAITKAFAVSAGSHTVNFLGRKNGGSRDPGVSGASVIAVFVDQDGNGSS